jgi:hypothetical protein
VKTLQEILRRCFVSLAGGVSDVGGEGFKEETLTCEDGVSDVSNVGFSEDTPKPPADCSNEMGEGAVVIGAQKIHDNNTNTNNPVIARKVERL